MYIPPSPGPITILSIFIKQQTRRVQTSMFSSYPGEFLLRLFRLIRHTHYCSEGNVMYLPVIQKWSILNIFLTMMSTCKFTNTHTMNKLCVLINWSALRPWLRPPFNKGQKKHIPSGKSRVVCLGFFQNPTFNHAKVL